jgi:hypothetical protein
MTAVNTPPQSEEPGQCALVGRCPDTQAWKKEQADQRQPKEAVGGECGGSESVTFLPFHHASDHLRQAAEENAHRQDHALHAEETGIVQIQQHRGHSEAHQSQWCWIRRSITCADLDGML